MRDIFAAGMIYLFTLLLLFISLYCFIFQLSYSLLPTFLPFCLFTFLLFYLYTFLLFYLYTFLLFYLYTFLLFYLFTFIPFYLYSYSLLSPSTYSSRNRCSPSNTT